MIASLSCVFESFKSTVVCTDCYGVWFELTQPLLRLLLPTAVYSDMEAAIYGTSIFSHKLTCRLRVNLRF